MRLFTIRGYCDDQWLLWAIEILRRYGNCETLFRFANTQTCAAQEGAPVFSTFSGAHRQIAVWTKPLARRTLRIRLGRSAG